MKDKISAETFEPLLSSGRAQSRQEVERGFSAGCADTTYMFVPTHLNLTICFGFHSKGKFIDPIVFYIFGLFYLFFISIRLAVCEGIEESRYV